MTAARPFVHLHLHTHYSLLDGANRIPDLAKKVKEQGMNAVAVTDHGNLYGAVEFYNTCRKNDLNPILGYEAYVAPGDRREKKAARMKEASCHLTLLAINRVGFKNLVKLASSAFLEGFYYKPRIDKPLLEAHSEGLICLSGCAAGELSQHLLADRMDEARKLTEWYARVFGDRFYMEIQNAGIEIQKLCADATIDLAKEYGIPLVATNDAHYLNQDDADAHDILLCVNTHATVDDEKRMTMTGDQLFVRSPEQMYEAFPDHPDAVSITQQIADRCDIDLDLTTRHFPVFKPPEGKSDTEYLRELCLKGMEWRYGSDVRRPSEAVDSTDGLGRPSYGGITQQHRDRLEYELQVIDRMGYSSYFLIVWDFVRFAREKGIPCQARGSAVGALVGYVLGLSNVCPIQYDLLFERFLDPNRSEPPDIDIDFCRDGRQAVIDYTKERYGEMNVAQIGTFGTLKAKAAIRDVSRAMGIDLKRVDEIAKMVPETLGIKLKDAIKQSADLQEAYNSDPAITRMLDVAIRLEGLARSAGTHAAGVVVADEPISNYIPLQTITGKTDIITQWDGPTVEMAGLLKMDFLGLRNLTILDKAVQNVTKHRGLDLDPDKLPIDDAETFALLQRGETKGIFQLESGGMRDLLTKMKPDQFEDIIATSALYRPGPLEGGMVTDYVERKHRRQAVPKQHPIIDDVLKDTYGVMVYQEQVMRILNRVGDIDLASAYKCIKAISKKKLDTIAKFREEFVAGAKTKDLGEQPARDLFGLIEKFAGYGFNKCVVGETVIVDAVTGARATVGELFQKQRGFTIHSLGDDGKLHRRGVTDVVWNGRKHVFEICTAQGKRLTATANHPLRTFDGWKRVDELKPGDRVAAPRCLEIEATERWPEHEVITLAHLIAEGNTCHPTCLYFYNDSSDAIEDFVAAVEQFPGTRARVDRRQDGKRMEVCVSTGRDTRFVPGQTPWNASTGEKSTCAVCEPPKSRVRSGAFEWAETLGILGLRAPKKRIPAQCFRLCDANVELLLGRLWSGDGHIGGKGQMPFYATSSSRLARDVQLLLLRLGILSGVHSKMMKYRYKGNVSERIGYTVHLIGDDSVRFFLERVLSKTVGRDDQVHRFRGHLSSLPESRSSKDTIPAEVRRLVDERRRSAGLKWRDLESMSGVSMKEFVGKGTKAKKGFRRSTISVLARFFSSLRLQQIAVSDVFWETITSIEPRGIHDTYDLTVESDHNFVADGLIVHNSHSTAYGAIAYQTAYMKAHYPLEFMAALLSCGMESTDRIAEHTDDCRRMGIEVLPPDVNASEVEFGVAPDQSPTRKRGTTNGKGAKANGQPKNGYLTFGLGAVKGVGDNVVNAIVAERDANGPFRSIFDLTERIDTGILTKGALEILVKAGALDSLGGNRAQLLAVVERAVQSAATLHRDKARGQKNLFGGDDEETANEPANVSLPDVPDWPTSQKLAFEKEVLGFYLTSHPLTQHAARLKKYASHRTPDLKEIKEGERPEVLIGGLISAIKKATTKKGGKYANFDFEDDSGTVRCIIWPEQFTKYAEMVKAEQICFVQGKVEVRGSEPNLIVDRILTPDEAEQEFTQHLAIQFRRGLHTPDDMVRVRDTLRRFPGKTDVVVVVDSADEAEPTRQFRYVMSTPARVACNGELRQALADAIGESYFQMHAAAPKRGGNGSIGR